MSAATKMFKTNHGFIPKLTRDNYPTWREKVRHLLVRMSAYNIVTGDELFPEGNGSAARTLLKEWHQRTNDAIALIYLGCTDDLLPWIDDIDDPVEMWQTLQGRLDNTTNQVGRTQIVCKFHALRPSQDEKITQYFTRLIDLRKKLIGSPETISDETMKITSSLPCQKNSKLELRYSNNKFQSQRPSKLWTDYERMLIELSLQRRSEMSPPDPLSIVTAETTIKNTAARTAK